MRLSNIIKQLQLYHLSFDIVANESLRVYPDKSKNYDVIRVSEYGDVEINGKISNLQNYIDNCIYE